MRSFIKAATLWQAATFCLSRAAALGLPRSSEVSPHDVSIVAGSVGILNPHSLLHGPHADGAQDSDSFSIQFQSSCRGCFVGTDDGLELELTLPVSDGECRSQQPILNGVPLAGVWTDDGAKGHGTFVAKLSNGLGAREFYATWETICMKDEASLLSVQIHKIVGQDEISDLAGFTVSFHGGPEPLVMRLSTQPTELSHDRDLVEQWLHPSEAQRLVVAAPVSSIDPTNPLEVEYQKLEALKFQIFSLHRELRHQEVKILHMLKSDFKACNGVRCLLQTALRKIPDFTQLITSHFRFQPKPGTGEKLATHSNCSRADVLDMVYADEAQYDELDAPMDATSATPAEHDDHHLPSLPPPPFEPDYPHPPFKPDSPHPPFQPDRPHPPFEPDHPHPPFEPGHPQPPFDGPPPPHHHVDHAPNPHPGHHGPPPNFRHHGHHHHVLKGALGLVVLALLMALVFRQVRKRRMLYRNDQRRSAERAARREERHNLLAYRRAARKHKWTQWWNRYRQPRSNADYEEKRALILQQEDVLESAMQHDINSLRTAHEIVGEMMRAEEGRAQMYYQANLPPSRRSPQAAEVDAGIGSSSHPSLPSYAAPPPTYDEEFEGDMTVVDGFSYTPSGTEETPDSSVIDYSPRLSFETGRTTLAKEPRD